jgi:hypothetical protein
MLYLLYLRKSKWKAVRLWYPVEHSWRQKHGPLDHWDISIQRWSPVGSLGPDMSATTMGSPGRYEMVSGWEPLTTREGVHVHEANHRWPMIQSTMHTQWDLNKNPKQWIQRALEWAQLNFTGTEFLVRNPRVQATHLFWDYLETSFEFPTYFTNLFASVNILTTITLEALTPSTAVFCPWLSQALEACTAWEPQGSLAAPWSSSL